jgi:hypothetical protein
MPHLSLQITAVKLLTLVKYTHFLENEYITKLKYEGCLESNLQWDINKTSNRGKNYYVQNIYAYLSYFST